MASPILIARGRVAAHGLGLAPHGAGRNFRDRLSRARHSGRDPEAWLAEETRGIDARFSSAHSAFSELPGSYKDAAKVRAEVEATGSPA